MTSSRKLELADDQMCFGCGPKNPRGLQLKFSLERAQRRIRTRWLPLKEFQGYREIVHGGMIGLVLDELMVNLLWTLQKPAVTAEFALRLRRPARVGEALDCEAWVREESGRIFQMEARAKNPRDEVVATATARCVTVEEAP